jgi:hypothetical protein
MVTRRKTRKYTGHHHHAGLVGHDPRRRFFDEEKKAWDAEQGLVDEDLESAIDLAIYFGEA